MIVAYHGSVRNIDKLDMSHAGTSGRRDYGHGLYFTQSPAIARKYGPVYQVAILADRAEFLDLDRPFRWQSKEVQAGVYRAIPQISSILRDAGLPGLRFFDHSGGDTPVNNYVVFRDDIVEILNRP